MLRVYQISQIYGVFTELAYSREPPMAMKLWTFCYFFFSFPLVVVILFSRPRRGRALIYIGCSNKREYAWKASSKLCVPCVVTLGENLKKFHLTRKTKLLGGVRAVVSLSRDYGKRASFTHTQALNWRRTFTLEMTRALIIFHYYVFFRNRKRSTMFSSLWNTATVAIWQTIFQVKKNNTKKKWICILHMGESINFVVFTNS